MRSLALLVLLALPLAAEVKVTALGTEKVNVEIDGKPFTTFYIGPETTKPYLHPLRAASGTIVSRRYPMETVTGETNDHIHQRGLWFSHGDVNGLDFWANDPSQQNPKKGKVVLKKLGALKSGKTGSITAAFNWINAEGKVLLTEDRTMTFHGGADTRMIDFDITFTGVEKSHFGDTKEGFFAIRVADAMNGKNSGKLVNANGGVGEKAVWGKRAPWVDYSGKLGGETVGMALLDHPGNPKHPPYWHSRDYGLFAINIFGEHDFYNDKSRDGSMILQPGQKWRFRVRLVIHTGDTQSAGIADQFAKYASAK
jgi:hypothetical protein